MRWVLTFVMMMLPVLAGAQQAQAPKSEKAQEAAAVKSEKAQEGPLKTEKDKLSYAMGMDLGGQLKASSVDIDPVLFAEGLKAMLAGSKTLLTDAEAKAVISQLQMAMVAKQAALAKAAGEKNKTEGEAFLAANKAKEGVVTLPSGLQYKVITNGTGPKPTLEQTVVCQYQGHAHRRQGVRQLLQARPAGDVPREGCDQGVDRGVAADAGRVEVAGVRPCGPRLRRARGGRGHRAERDADIRDRTGGDQVAGSWLVARG